MTLEHGRTRYTRGCRCELCKAAERDYQRNRYQRQRGLATDDAADTPGPVLTVVTGSDADSSDDGPVVAAVHAELDAAPAAGERPGMAAIALALAAILDDPKHVAAQPAAARQLVAILNTLTKRGCRYGKLAVVKSMTTSSPAQKPGN